MVFALDKESESDGSNPCAMATGLGDGGAGLGGVLVCFADCLSEGVLFV